MKLMIQLRNKIKKIKMCTLCEDKEAIVLHKALITGCKSYLCEDCIIRIGETHKNAKKFRQKKEPWTIK